jgi:ABC-2 type transport system ATP-binding protein
MEEADHLCNRLAIMDHGRLLALDTPAGLKHSLGAGTEVRVSATGDLTALAEHLSTHLDGVLTSRVMGGMVRLTATSSVGLLPRVIQVSDAAGFTVTDLSVTEPTLETVFINLTGKDLRE